LTSGILRLYDFSMNINTEITQPLLFQQKEIRRIWYQRQWYFSVVDIVGALAETPYPRQYWEKIKQREFVELQLSPFWLQLKLMASDGKMYLTDCANQEGILRIIQSIPSKKAEPFKLWLAKVGNDRIEEIKNPELAMIRMRKIYQAKGYPDEWIEKRVRGIAVRNELTDEWNDRGIKHSLEYAILTNEIMKGTFGMKVGEYKKFKNIKKENLRDHMDGMELIFTMLGEATTMRITQKKDSRGFPKLKVDAKEAGNATGKARKIIENKIREKVSTPKNYLSNIVKKIK
jgi:DNA-damage-inducible protein D